MAVWPRQAHMNVAAAGRATLVAAAVFCVALVLLVVARGDRSSGHRLSSERALAAALADHEVRAYLGRSGYTRDRITPLDDRLVRVSFFNGGRIVLEAAVAPDGTVPHRILYRPGYVRSGSETAQRPWVLLLLCAAFALVTMTVPLRSLRNLDVLALVSFVAPVLLLNERLLEASAYVSYPPLAYLAGRCLRTAFRPPGEPRHARAEPLYERVTRALDVGARRRVLGIGLAGSAAALVLLSVPGGLVGDVAFASMAGATDLVHGTLPYGHLPAGDLVHGDTYPLLAYAAYVPVALITPVKNAFDNLDGALYVAAAFALAGAAAMYLAGRRITGEATTGLRLALAWLCFPPVVIAASSGSNDMAAAMGVALAAALLAYPAGSAVAMTLAGWVKLAPLVALPVLILRWRPPGLARALAGVVAVTVLVIGWVVALAGTGGLGDMLDAISFQAERGSLLSLWTLTGARAIQLVFQAALLTLVVLGTARIRRDRGFASDPRRVAALAAAILLGVQIAANYWTYAYLPWVFPLVAIALLCEGRSREPLPGRTG